jgi:hypothetical protein
MRARHWWGLYGFGIAVTVASGCAGEDSASSALSAFFGGGPCGTAYLADVEDEFVLDVDLATPGASPEIVFDMAIPGLPGDMILLTREITITLPASFGFNGFGAPGASVGQWDFDFGIDQVYQPPADYTIPHRAIDANQAYADTRLNGAYDAGVDSVATHTTGVGGEHIVSVVLPSGGTDNNGAGGNCSYFPTDTRFTLPAGIVVLPSTPGQYDVSITATSVDPDTGDQNDGQGTPPTVYQRVVPITVPESGATASLLAAAAALGRLCRRRAA